MKEEAAEKRRQEIQQEQVNKLSKQKLKMEQAAKRRSMVLEQKKRAA